jgi:hypothetical protein
MDYSEEYYKMKYFKYKSKYFELKHKLEGGEGEAGDLFKGTGRIFKKVGKSLLGSLGFTKTPKQEREEILKIITKYNLTEGVIKNNELYQVASFLNNLKSKIAEAKKENDQEKINKLNYVLGKHYMCKGITSLTYDQKDCFEPTN